MPDFITTVKGLVGNAVPPDAVDGLIEMVVQDVAGSHRWPFLLKVQQPFTWAANDAIQIWPGVARIFNIMAPNSGGDYYRLDERSDDEFQKWIELNPDDTELRVWRDAGLSGNGDLQIEVYGVPTASKSLKVDYVELPTQAGIDVLPSRFRLLVLMGVRAHIGLNGVSLFDYAMEKERVIAREKDLQGKRGKIGRDGVQSMRWRNVNNPS